MNERRADSMLSFAANTLPLQVTENLTFAMPRVVPDQRTTFENDEFFRKLSRDSEVRYTGFRERPMEERQLRFQADAREGHADLAFVSTGTNLQLNFVTNSWSDQPEDRVPTLEFVNFEEDPGKVHLKSQFILNGVCVLWRGCLDLVRLDGVGCLELDVDRAAVEDVLLREQIEQNNRRVQEFEERRRQRQQEQQRQTTSEAEARSRRKSRPRKDIHAISTINSTSKNTSSSSTNSTGSTSTDIITTITATTTTSISLPISPAVTEGMTVISEPTYFSKPERPHRSHFNRALKCKHRDRELQIVEGEEAEVDVVAIEGETDKEAGVGGVIGTCPEIDIVAPPRDKIRKSDTIWSPWK